MCGFVVTTSKKIIEKKKVQSSLELISHRGPDNDKLISINNMYFGFVRLSIQDLSEKAMQPMQSQNKRYIMVFNGEIYNYKSLRNNLINFHNKNFETSSDSEVLIEHISQYGLEETLAKLKGMFAFVLFDKSKNKLYLCRDHFGQKNLYFFLENSNSKGELIIASEIKAFLPFMNKLTPDKEKIASLLFMDHIPNDGSIFKEISEVKPGHFYIVDTENINNLNEFEYFHPCKLVDKELYEELDAMPKRKIINRLDKLMQNSSDLHSVSDAKLGLLFSTGIDSHLLLTYLDKYNLELFHAASKMQIGNSIVDEISDFHKCKINKIDIDNERSLFYDLPKLIWNYEQPNQIEGLMLAKICNLAKSNNFKVLISGCCADELFGGYPYYNHYAWDVKKTLLLKNNKKLRKFFNIFGDLIGSPDSLAIHNILCPTSLERISDFISYQINGKDINKNFDRAFASYSFLDKEEDILNNAYLLEELNTRMLRFLHRNDRFSMQESIELRVPFLDLDLVKFIINIPPKIRTGAPNLKHSRFSKPLIRELLSRRTNKSYPKRLQVKQGPNFNFLSDLNKISTKFNYRNLEDILDLPNNYFLSSIKEGKYKSFKLRYNLLSTEILLDLFINKENIHNIQNNIKDLLSLK